MQTWPSRSLELSELWVLYVRITQYYESNLVTCKSRSLMHEKQSENYVVHRLSWEYRCCNYPSCAGEWTANATEVHVVVAWEGVSACGPTMVTHYLQISLYMFLVQIPRPPLIDLECIGMPQISSLMLFLCFQCENSSRASKGLFVTTNTIGSFRIWCNRY